MKFKNKPNTLHKTIDKKEIWESRSVAITCLLSVWCEQEDEVYILISKRGKGTPDFQGYWNIVCGYLDWNENAHDACIREVWEETGIDINKLLKSEQVGVMVSELHQPYFVQSSPKSNRQNVTLRHGIQFSVDTSNDIAKYFKCTDINSEPNEVDGYAWVTIDDLNKYEWAFNHDEIIVDYIYNI